jgi:hypothetical protein
MPLYDYIYVDLDKVISIYSQMTGGVVEVHERSSEHTHSADNKRNYDFKVFKHDAGGSDNDKTSLKEIIKPHHSLLTEMEDALGANGYLVDLTVPHIAKSFKDPNFRAQLKDTFCIKVRGRAVIEDYQRLKSIAEAFPDVTKFINQSSESVLRASPAFLNLKTQIQEAEQAHKLIKDKNVRSIEEQRLKSIKEALSELLASARKVGTVDQWILDGMKTWINAFLPGIVNLRIYPDIERPDELTLPPKNVSLIEAIIHDKEISNVSQTTSTLHTRIQA